MKTVIKNETEKIITAESGKVLSNGGEFDSYPVQLTVNINDNTWFEILREDTIPEIDKSIYDLLLEQNEIVEELING